MVANNMQNTTAPEPSWWYNHFVEGSLRARGAKRAATELQIGPLLRIGPNVIFDETFITLGSSNYTCAFVQILIS